MTALSYRRCRQPKSDVSDFGRLIKWPNSGYTRVRVKAGTHTQCRFDWHDGEIRKIGGYGSPPARGRPRRVNVHPVISPRRSRTAGSTITTRMMAVAMMKARLI